MAIDEEPVNEVKEALIAFFERHGGYKEVAKKMSANPQHLYYIISGRNDPTLKTVMRILRYYPNEVELRRALSLPVLTSTTQVFASTANSPATDGEWKERYYAMDERYTQLEAKFDQLFEKYNSLVDRFMAKMAFNPSDSQSTAIVTARAGFKWYDEPQAGIGRVIPMYRHQPGTIRLNSLESYPAVA